MIRRIFGSLGFLSLFVSLAAVAQVPRSHHVVVVTLENHSYEQVVGNASMPYFNQLAGRYGLATAYDATQHDSLPALMWMVAGAKVVTNSNTQSLYDVDSLARRFIADGRTWTSFTDGLPSVGYTGLSTGHYIRWHNPFVYFTDVANSTAERQNLRPYAPYFQQAVQNGTLPEFSWVVPGDMGDAYHASLAAADQWLQANVAPLLASPAFQQDGLLLITFDEGQASDMRGHGGRVATLVIGPQVRRGYQSTVSYAHQNLLATVCAAMALSACPGAGATSAPMSDFFQPSSAPAPVPTPAPALALAASASAVSGGIHVSASAGGPHAIAAIAVYVDGSVKSRVHNAAALDAVISTGRGAHAVVVNAWDTTGALATAQQRVQVP